MKKSKELLKNFKDRELVWFFASINCYLLSPYFWYRKIQNEDKDFLAYKLFSLSKRYKKRYFKTISEKLAFKVVPTPLNKNLIKTKEEQNNILSFQLILGKEIRNYCIPTNERFRRIYLKRLEKLSNTPVAQPKRKK